MISQEEWTERKAFSGFTDEDAALLEELAPHAEAFADDVVDALYDRFLAFPHTRDFLSDPAVLKRVKGLQRSYFIELTSGDYGQDYLENRERIGVIHQRIGLGPRWYLGAYAVYIETALPRVLTAFGEHGKGSRVATALMKLISLDMQLAIDAYIQALTTEVERGREEASELAATLDARLSELLTSQARNRELVDRAVHGIVRTDPVEQTVLYANPAAARMLGYADAEELIRSIRHIERDLVVDSSDTERFLKTLAADGEVRNRVVTLRRKEGGTIVVRMNSWVVRGLGGDVECYESIVEDVTEERVREERLLLMEAAVVNAGDAVVMLKADTEDPSSSPIIYTNEAFTHQTGYSMQEVVGSSPQFLASPRTDARVLRGLSQDLAAGRAARAEVVNRRKDGRDIWVDTNVFPIHDAEGKISHLVSIRRETTKRREIENRLRQLSMAVEQSQDLVMITDPQGVIEYVNPAFERVTGWSHDAVIGESPAIMSSGRHDEGFYHRLWQTLLGGKTFRGVTVKQRQNGEEWEEEQTIHPLRDEEGKIIHFVSTGRDVTERRALEAQLRHSQRVEALGQLAGSVAHDFNNLLTVITASAELLRLDLGEGNVHGEELDDIRTAATRGGDLTAQLLAFGRKSEMSPRLVDLADIVAKKANVLRRLFKSVDLVIDVEEGPVPAFVDVGSIDQVLMNLAINARDAMSAPGTLTIRARVEEILKERPGRPKAGVFARLDVIDTGSGMDDITRAHIFEPFYTTKAEGRGTGLGLSTVLGIVDQSGGFIELESEVGKGTAFRVYLPATDPATIPEEPNVAAPDGELILLVDDDEAAGRSVAHVLQRLGYRVTRATSGVGALEVLKDTANEIAIVVTDYVMPGMSGGELADWIATHRPEIPVVLMSGHTEDPRVVHLSGSPSALLTKPFEAEELDRAIRKALDGSPKRRGDPT